MQDSLWEYAEPRFPALFRLKKHLEARQSKRNTPIEALFVFARALEEKHDGIKSASSLVWRLRST